MKDMQELPALPEEPAPKKTSFFRRLFKRSTPEDKAAVIVKTMRKQKPKKRKRLQRKSLQQYLDKAGFEADAATVKRNTFRTIILLFLISTGVLLYKMGCWGENACAALGVWKTLGLITVIWTVVFLGALLLAMGAVYFYLDYWVYRRTREMEDVLADFLQLASANISAGMPIDRALWYSIRPSFGVLAREMEEVAKATMSGESLEESLIKFSRKYDSVLLKRSVSILIEGLQSGGELADLLNKIALNIDEIKVMKKEMAASVTTYAIFILIAAVCIAPVLFALATQLLTIIVAITGSLDLSTTQTFFSIGAVDPGMITNFERYSYMMLIVSSLFGASIVSVIKRGNVMEGIKGIPLFAAAAVVIYLLSSSLFGGIFGGII